MALLHVDATISPTKVEVVTLWLRQQTWLTVDPNDPVVIGSYRFDDPAGEVGLEVIVAQLGGDTVVQVPLTYRGAPLAGAEDFWLCTMSHTALGDRSVYAGAGDPVFVAALVAAIRTGATQAPLQYEQDGELLTRDAVVTVRGSGDRSTTAPCVEWVGAEVGRPITVVHTSEVDVMIPHVLDVAGDAHVEQLTGRYPDLDHDVLLATLR